MSRIFIYYSLTSNGDEVAKYLESRGFGVRKVIEKKKMPKRFFWMILAGGFRAGMNQKGKLIDYDSDVSSFDEVVIGSPIWNARFTPAINSVLLQTDLKDKKLIFVLYSGSGQGPKAEARIKKEYPNAKIIFLKEPKKYPNEFEKIKEL